MAALGVPGRRAGMEEAAGKPTSFAEGMRVTAAWSAELVRFFAGDRGRSDMNRRTVRYMFGPVLPAGVLSGGALIFTGASSISGDIQGRRRS
jgi:hypothetical protein